MKARATTKKIKIGPQLPPVVWAQFVEICEDTGASVNYCLERVLRDVINQGAIPGLGAIDAHKEREAEKFGSAAVPTYDGDKETSHGR